MQFLRTLSLFQVLIFVTVKSKAESVYTGTEGGSVDIDCKYPDGYQYNAMYFCRDPCTSSNVLIKSEKADTAVSKGRYIAVNTVSAQSFSVTIRHLTLKDSGVYYCGLDKWGTDKLTKIKLTISKVLTVTTNTPGTTQNESPNITQFPRTTSVIPSTADTILSNEQASSTPNTSLDPHGRLLGVCGGMLGLILCCVFVALVIFYRMTSSKHITTLKPPAPDNLVPHEQEDLCHVYDEMLDIYSLAGPATGDSTATYSTIQPFSSADNVDSLYSL